jgi:hypothetical protein
MGEGKEHGEVRCEMENDTREYKGRRGIRENVKGVYHYLHFWLICLFLLACSCYFLFRIWYRSYFYLNAHTKYFERKNISPPNLLSNQNQESLKREIYGERNVSGSGVSWSLFSFTFLIIFRREPG